MMYYRGISGVGHCVHEGLGYMSSGMGWVMMAGVLLVGVLVMALLVMLVKKAHGNRMTQGDSESLSLLNERFVKGEISEEEYIKMKKVLHNK